MTEKKIIWEANWTGPEEEAEELVAYDKKGRCLGLLNYGDMMQWCWYQEQGTPMPPSYLQEVRDKQKELIRNGLPR